MAYFLCPYNSKRTLQYVQYPFLYRNLFGLGRSIAFAVIAISSSYDRDVQLNLRRHQSLKPNMGELLVP